MLMPRFCARCSLLSCYLLPLFVGGFLNVARVCVYFLLLLHIYVHKNSRAHTSLTPTFTYLLFSVFIFSLSPSLAISLCTLALTFVFIYFALRSLALSSPKFSEFSLGFVRVFSLLNFLQSKRLLLAMANALMLWCFRPSLPFVYLSSFLLLFFFCEGQPLRRESLDVYVSGLDVRTGSIWRHTLSD